MTNFMTISSTFGLNFLSLPLRSASRLAAGSIAVSRSQFLPPLRHSSFSSAFTAVMLNFHLKKKPPSYVMYVSNPTGDAEGLTERHSQLVLIAFARQLSFDNVGAFCQRTPSVALMNRPGSALEKVCTTAPFEQNILLSKPTYVLLCYIRVRRNVLAVFDL